jgi:hypothetical protein
MRAFLLLLSVCGPLLLGAQGPPTYCAPLTTDGTSAGDYIDGILLENIVRLGSGGTGGPGYQDLRYTSPDLITRLAPGGSYTLQVIAGDRADEVFSAWIDMDQDLVFEEAERLGSTTSTGPGSVGSISFTVPLEARPGYTAMRVRCVHQVPLIDPCQTYTYGETEDLSVLIDGGSPCIPLIPYGNTGGETITAVTLNTFTFNAPSQDAAPYVDHRELGAMLSIGIFYNLSITTGPASSELVAAWIDWNNDGDWSDAGELVGQGYASTAFQTVVFSFTVPANTIMGQRVMRVRAWDSGSPPDACADRLFGETEDYTVGLRNPGFLCFPVAGNTLGGDELVSLEVGGAQFASPAEWPFHTVHDDVPVRLVRGLAQTLDLVSGDHFPSRYQLWVDANYDGDFNDAGEALANATSVSAGQGLTLSFTLPANMDPGQTHLRLRCSDGNAPAPQSCASSTTGEIEDVVIVVEDASGPCIPYVAQWTQRGDHIDGVQLGALGNVGTGSTRGRAYNDYRALSAPINVGTPYDLFLTAGADSLHTFDAFIDLNGDADLEDVDEHLGRVQTTVPGAQATISFTLPSTALPGNALFRVRASDADTLIGGCGDLAPGTGETEDYTVIISTSTGTFTPEPSTFKVISRSDQGSVVLLAPEQWIGELVQVFDAAGRCIHQGRVEGQTTMIPAGRWGTGAYTLRVGTSPQAQSRVFIWP